MNSDLYTIELSDYGIVYIVTDVDDSFRIVGVVHFGRYDTESVRQNIGYYLPKAYIKTINHVKRYAMEDDIALAALNAL